MKFLLTSAGIKNTSLEQTLIDLIGRPMHEIFVVFVPTAASFGDGDKKWLIEDFEYFAKNCKAIDIVDISAVPKENWLRRFEAADVICFGGGDEQYLVKTMRESGVTEALPKLLETRVYMGISAGSMVVGKLLPNELTKELWPEESFVGSEEGIGMYDFSILPHLNSEYFAHLRTPLIESMKERFPRTVYALDDNSALKIVDDKIEVVSEGEFLKLEK